MLNIMNHYVKSFSTDRFYVNSLQMDFYEVIQKQTIKNDNLQVRPDKTNIRKLAGNKLPQSGI